MANLWLYAIKGLLDVKNEVYKEKRLPEHQGNGSESED
jgi:hypothetical protein